MRVGLLTFQTEQSWDIVRLGQLAEELGFESLFVADHSHIPCSQRSQHPGPPLPDGPQRWARVFEPFVCLGAVAATTDRLLLGTAVTVVTERDPIALAKLVTTLDQLSSGRFVFGVGSGWNVEAMENHGADPASRFKLMRERVLAMRQIWAHDEAAFHGELVDFDPLWLWPKPHQQPAPPILIGGAGPRVLERVVDYGDGWIPSWRTVQHDLEERVGRLRDMAERAGRDRPSVTVLDEEPPRSLVQQPDITAAVEHLEHAGVDRWILRVPMAGEDQVVDYLRWLAHRVLP